MASHTTILNLTSSNTLRFAYQLIFKLVYCYFAVTTDVNSIVRPVIRRSRNISI